jgi:antitoxin (DNA-binding transcriptional repressor) of toxin-antitoxin stability system
MSYPMEQVKPMSPVNGDRALVFTVRDLNQRTGQVMDEIEKYQRPAVITRRGRFVALIQPLAAGQVESLVLGAMAREMGQQEELLPPRAGIPAA